ncbi:hypothetical protein BKA69DRAFT_618305 [Paraphysoderma sedebokerense]|nr:hypothetical protein BKA69DRAFT_618305 [Paraphysoderma sedebokerense]
MRQPCIAMSTLRRIHTGQMPTEFPPPSIPNTKVSSHIIPTRLDNRTKSQVRIAANLYQSELISSAEDDIIIDWVISHGNGFIKESYTELIEGLFSKSTQDLSNCKFEPNIKRPDNRKAKWRTGSALIYDMAAQGDSGQLNAHIIERDEYENSFLDGAADLNGIASWFHKNCQKPENGGSQPIRWKCPQCIWDCKSSQKRITVGLGHSWGGAVSLLSTSMSHSATRPHFDIVIAIEPIMFPPTIKETIGSGNNMLAMAARRRRNSWTARKDAKSYFLGKTFFKNWTESALDAYVTYGTIESRQEGLPGYKLKTSPEHEARAFETKLDQGGVYAYTKLPQIDSPVLLIATEQTELMYDFICSVGRNALNLSQSYSTPDVARDFMMQIGNDKAHLAVIQNENHQITFENPKLLASVIVEYLNYILSEPGSKLTQQNGTQEEVAQVVSICECACPCHVRNRDEMDDIMGRKAKL